jgi:HAD superfamily hydrolase (TIGR01509 family)
MIAWICDVNGVLLDSAAYAYDAFAATASRYGFTFTPRKFHVVKSLTLHDAYRRLEPGGDTWTRRQFHLSHLAERIADIRAFPGVKDVLTAARARDVKIGAVTSYGRIAEAGLVSTGLYPLIECLVTQEEVKRPKPHPDLLVTALSLLGISGRDAGQTLHIGDTVADIDAARAAGVRPVGVTYGFSTKAEIRLARPDLIINSFHEMHDLDGRGSLAMRGTDEGVGAVQSTGQPQLTHAELER